MLSGVLAHLPHSARAAHVSHLARVEHVAHLAHVEPVAGVAHLASVLVLNGCPSNGDPWLCRDSGATYVVGGRVGVSETACVWEVS